MQRHGARRHLANRAVAGILLAIAAGLVPRNASGQATSARLTVVVIDQASGERLRGAQVRITTTGAGAVTDHDGRALIAGIRPGNHIVVVQRLGYTPESVLIEFTPGAAVDGEFPLRAAATTLAAVEVSAARQNARLEARGFYRRMQSNGFGTFLTEEDLERRRRTGGTLVDLLRNVPGLTFEHENGTPVLYATRGSDSILLGRCKPRIYVDGVLMSAMSEGLAPYDIGQFISPADIGGIEVYPSGTSAPLELGGGSGCGAVVIWSR